MLIRLLHPFLDLEIDTMHVANVLLHPLKVAFKVSVLLQQLRVGQNYFGHICIVLDAEGLLRTRLCLLLLFLLYHLRTLYFTIFL